MFDSIINDVQKKFNLGDKGGSLLSSLLGLIANPANGGFGGFISRFRNAGLGGLVDSWVNTGDNTPISNEQLESALGADTIDSVAKQSGLDRNTATSALGYLTPHVVDTLTPDGEVPDEASLLSRIGGFLGGIGGTVGGAVLGAAGMAGAAMGGATDKVGDAASATYNKGKDVLGGGINSVSNAAGAVGGRASSALNSVGDTLDGDGDGGGILKWLIPLLLLGLLVVLGYWFCGKSTPTTTTVSNNNGIANKGNANMTNVNSNPVSNTNVNAITTGERKLTEVTLPNGTKLEAYPGGIEDQLVKFIGSEEYKNGTAETLKNKWFSFDDLNFKFGTTELAPESKRQLDNIVAILKAFPDLKMKIGAYTDKKGDDAGNLKLSDTRAKAVKTALDKAGVGAQIPETEGYGEKFATVAETASDEERKVDRKTAIRLIK